MREDGFYWVKDDGFWIVAKWSDSTEAWLFAGTDFFCDDSELQEINETKLIYK